MKVRVVMTAEYEIEGVKTFETAAEAKAFAGGWQWAGSCYGAGACVAYVEGSGELAELADADFDPGLYGRVMAALKADE